MDSRSMVKASTDPFGGRPWSSGHRPTIERLCTGLAVLAQAMMQPCLKGKGRRGRPAGCAEGPTARRECSLHRESKAWGWASWN